MDKVIIYTDGSCYPNPGPGGWAAILIYGKEQKIVQGNQEPTTNNRMEMMAVLKALHCLKRPCNIDLYTDSNLVIGWLQHGWSRNIPAIDRVYKQIQPLLQQHKVKFHWVKGHSGDLYNDLVDERAMQQRLLLRD